jgi:competence protein ComEC
MTLAANTARLVGRRNHTPSALSLVACIMLLAWPPTAASIGFWLSVFAVFGLTVFCPLITAHLICLFTGRSQSGPGRKWLGRVFEPAGLTVTAQLFTLPLTAPLFATISLISPLANLLAAPLVTLMVGGGIVAACLVPLCSDLSLVVFRLLCLVGQAAAQLSEWLSGIPYASWPVAVDMVPTLLLFLLLAALLYLLWPQPGPRPRLGLALMLVAAVCANVLCLNLPTGAQLIVMDVGQGDALIIRDGRNCVLIDTGPDEKALLRALARNNISHIDAVVLTHLDLDHCGALSALRGTIPTEDVFFAADLLTYQADDAAVSAAAWLDADGASELASQDQLLVSGQLTLTVVWPAEPVREGGNDQSLCLRLSYDCNLDGQPETQALLTGDAELPELRLILADDPQTYQVLKVGHHGSNDAIGLEELQLMRTEIALICVGADNYYGHPTAQTLTTLEAADVALFRTDLHGDITLDFGPTAIQVSYDSIAPELTSR